MNRPIKPNIRAMRSGKTLAIELYINDLEKYCDYLEEEFRLKKVELGFAKLHREWDREKYDRRIEQANKALDKACDKLFNEMVTIEDKECGHRLMHSVKEWKEWLLGND